MLRVCKLVDSTTKYELEASTSKPPIEGRYAAFCANLMDLKVLPMKQYKIDCEREQQNLPENEERMQAEVLTLMIFVVSTRKVYLVKEPVPGALYRVRIREIIHAIGGEASYDLQRLTSHIQR